MGLEVFRGPITFIFIFNAFPVPCFGRVLWLLLMLLLLLLLLSCCCCCVFYVLFLAGGRGKGAGGSYIYFEVYDVSLEIIYACVFFLGIETMPAHSFI